MGFGKGPYLPAPQEEDEDNLLSPETCYECKINGYPKRGRQRRSVNGTERHQVRNPGHPGGAGARQELDPFRNRGLEWIPFPQSRQSQQLICICPGLASPNPSCETKE